MKDRLLVSFSALGFVRASVRSVAVVPVPPDFVPEGQKNYTIAAGLLEGSHVSHEKGLLVFDVSWLYDCDELQFLPSLGSPGTEDCPLHGLSLLLGTTFSMSWSFLQLDTK